MAYETVEYRRMGDRTFFVFFLRWAGVFVAALIVLAALLIFLTFYAPDRYAYLRVTALEGGLPVLAVILVGTWLLARMEYGHYSVRLTPVSVEVRRGVFSISLNGVAYKRIRDVMTNRTLIERLLGTSTVVINLTGEVGEESEVYPMTIALPCLERTVADHIHDELVKRSGEFASPI